MAMPDSAKMPSAIADGGKFDQALVWQGRGTLGAYQAGI
jgi:hypothetical protein